jgi:peptidoglycan/xylan/chitin deacetylase (PgdA/CDA1 family)
MHPESGNRGGIAWRQLAAAGLYRCGAFWALHTLSRHLELTGNGSGKLLRWVKTAKYVVLGYHRVGTGGVPLYCRFPQQAFARQMEYVRKHFRVISVRQMAQELQEPRAHGQAVVVTFDDGYAGTYTEAFPILQKYAIPATVYLVAGAVETGEVAWYDRIFLALRNAPQDLQLRFDRPRRFRLETDGDRIAAGTEVVMYLRTLPDEERQAWCAALEERLPVRAEDLRGAMVTWDHVRTMHRAGITFGAHTMTHPVASRLPPEVLRREVEESKHLIEQRIQSAVEEFAFPFGKARDCGAVGRSALAQLGFRTALTSIVGVNRPGADLFRLRRLMGEDISLGRFAFRLHQLFFHPVDEELGAIPAES